VKIISIINLKGGVAKTITAANMAHILAKYHEKKVLLFDNDKQGNVSKLFGVHNYDRASAADLLTDRRVDIHSVIRKTQYGLIDVLPANMSLLKANLETLLDTARPQQTRFRAALNGLDHEYSYCIFDNAPDINISTINALVTSDEVIIPITIDDFAFDGLAELKEQIDVTSAELNGGLRLLGCLITAFRHNEANIQGEEWLRARPEYPIFETKIRWSAKVTESTFARTPIADYSRGSAAAIDYVRFVAEYLKKTLV
jgi:chromosome partitioning protein